MFTREFEAKYCPETKELVEEVPQLSP